jgi:hypothetical protein
VGSEHIKLVGVVWNMAGLFFHSVGNFIIPTDELIFFRGLKPPTSKRMVKEAQILGGFRLLEWALPNRGKSNQRILYILLGITWYNGL